MYYKPGRFVLQTGTKSPPPLLPPTTPLLAYKTGHRAPFISQDDMHAVFCWGQFLPNSSVVVCLISYPHICPLCGRKPSTYKFYYAWSAMMHTKGTRRMFLKMEQRRSLEKLGVCNTAGVCHQLSSGFGLKHDMSSGNQEL